MLLNSPFLEQDHRPYHNGKNMARVAVSPEPYPTQTSHGPRSTSWSRGISCFEARF